MNIEDAEQLREYLVRTDRVRPGTEVSSEPLAGGVSARTVLVRHGQGTDWVLKQALPRLRVESEWCSDPARIHREAEALRWLGRILPSGATPRFLFEDHDHHVLAMEAVPRPHRSWKEMLLRGEVHAGHVRQFAQILAMLHRVGGAGTTGGAAETDGAGDADASGDAKRSVLETAFGDRAFFESLRVEPYYAYTATRVPAAAGFLSALIEETRALRLTLVHGDYSPKNVLVHDDRLVLLDHEVVHLGDPAFDLGFSLTHLLSKAHHLPTHRTAFRGAVRFYWETYRAAAAGSAWLEGLEARAVRHALGCLLARAAGRSPLEYLSADERARQRDAATSLMGSPPASVAGVIDDFLDRV